MEQHSYGQVPAAVEAVARLQRPLRTRADLAPLIAQLQDRKIVMLGEASHGTQEFYAWRSAITQELLESHGFCAVAVEGDWPPCAELTRFIHGGPRDARPEAARAALRAFHRWPTWMWANSEIQALAVWMRTHSPAMRPWGFYGLDVYSLFESMAEVLRQLRRADPMLERRARIRYECFDSFQGDERAYARSLLEFPEGCERQVIQVLGDCLRASLNQTDRRKDALLFDARQNALVVANAEAYYRALIRGDADSWNVRDQHMMETLDYLLDHYGAASKIIVWAHNTHIGDYRATSMMSDGQLNIGGLAREEWGDERVALVGFGTHQGEVIASRAWGGETETMRVPEGRPATYEAVFHEAAARAGLDATIVDLRARTEPALATVLGHRAIGVVYNPAHERFGNYVPTMLSHRYDHFVFVDRTTALTPLEQAFAREEFPETWPGGQ